MEVLVKKCINAKNYALTVGTEYNVVVQGDYYVVTNDNNKNQRYYKTLFQDVVVTPPTPPTPVYTYDISGNGSINIVKDGVLEKTVAPLNSEESTMSCGVREFDGLNSLFTYVHSSNLSTEQAKEALILSLRNSAGSEQTAFCLFSTNTNNEYFEKQSDVMSQAFGDELISNETNYNPNSSNHIILWVVKVS
jgi:hypothetical protein